MHDPFESVVFWIALSGLIVATWYLVNFIMRCLTNSCQAERARYRHRIANQLPRELHTEGRDEVLELKDATELRRK